jgi:hypothetical protein
MPRSASRWTTVGRRRRFVVVILTLAALAATAVLAIPAGAAALLELTVADPCMTT